MSLRRAVRAVAVLMTVVLAAAPAALGATTTNWTSWGQNLSNTRNSTDTTIGVGNVAKLAPKWRLATQGNVSATPAVADGVVYAPDTAGNLYAVDAASGSLRWRTSIPAATGIPGDYSRATPAIAGNVLILGDQAGKAFSPDGYVLGLDKQTGALLWRTKVAGGYPILTQSPTVVDGVAYIGVASYEELLVRFGFPLTFRGSMMAIDVATGAVKWQTYLAPDGYTGASVWGSSPAVDTKRGTVYVATGNNYSVPDSVSSCLAAATTDTQRAACIPADDMFDSVVALDMTSGAVKWAFRALPADAWNVACGIPFPGFEEPTPGCPTNAGPDYDFAQAPMLFKARGTDVVGAGQKSGRFWALDPSSGAVLWSTEAGPGGVAGGLQWGSAADSSRVYAANANSESKPWTLTDGSSVSAGGWTALDQGTGRILWQRPNPTGAGAPGPVTVANGVVYACSADADGHMYAMKAADGTVLWDFPSRDTCYGGAAVANGSVFWGTGYTLGTADTDSDQALYAFTLGGK